MIRSTGLAALAMLGTLMLAAGTGSANERVALVIGNSEYRNAEALPNPRNDANAMGNTLEGLGFEVDLRVDLDQRGMQGALRDFGLKAEAADVALIFYAGHGVQVGNENYLLPVDARLERERDLIYEAMPLSVVMGEAAQASRVGVVILDACRDNPLAEALRRSLGPIRSRLVGQGLARVDNPPANTLIAFSTEPGEVAVDGEGSMSPFTAALVETLEQPGLEIDLLFRKVRDQVLAATAYRQRPLTFNALGAEPFYFKPLQPNRNPSLPALTTLEVLDNVSNAPLGIGRPTDPDDDELTAEISILPANGTASIEGRALRVGDTLTIDQLLAVAFTPDPDAAGMPGAFQFQVRDEHGGSTVGRVPITVETSNRAPVIAANPVLSLPPIPLGIPAPTDPEGDPITIKVAGLPAGGRILSGEQPIAVGDEMTPDELAALTLDAGTDGASGNFAFEVIDDQGATTEGSIAINIPAFSATVSAPTAAQQQQTALALAGPDEDSMPRAMSVAPQLGRVATPSAERLPYLTLRPSNIRSQPTSDSERVATVPAGEELQVTGANDDQSWFQVETADGQEGYIFARLVEPKPGAAAAPEAPAAVETPAAPTAAPELLQQQAALAVGRASADQLQDCPQCPILAQIPPGSFTMGSDLGDASEQPERKVAIGEPFLIGVHEVTVAQWQACVDAGGCSDMPRMRDATPRSPVHNLSWNDVQDYLGWLGSVTGKNYRLPTEAEWEYAARAGTSSRYWWGDRIGNGNANCEECGGPWERLTPAEVGSFQPNPFGLHDMNGGVMEWVADCWYRDHSDAPNDGSARIAPDCNQRALRGGSWRNDANYATASSRLSYDANVRYYTNGFRVARDL